MLEYNLWQNANMRVTLLWQTCPQDSDMAKNITEKVIESIAPDNQLISVVEDQGFWIHVMPYNLGITLYWLHFWVTMCRYAHKFCRSHTAEHVKQALDEMVNVCEIDKQRVDVILHDK